MNLKPKHMYANKILSTLIAKFMLLWQKVAFYSPLYHFHF